VAADHHTDPVLIRAVAAADVRPLRRSVLRPGRAAEDSVYAGDDDPDTVHLAAFDGGRLAAIASLYSEPRPGTGARATAWRLRGMATDPALRGRGLGAAVLAACEAHVAASGGGELWCNARLPVVGFYLAGGFAPVGEEFDIPGIGPHVVMTKQVARPG
jgi:predicted GNAT family N-acyltransferase